MGELSTLPNIRKIVEQQLIEIGSKQAWLRIKSIDDPACINRLYALEGVVEGIRWHNLSEEIKVKLKEFYNTFKLLYDLEE